MPTWTQTDELLINGYIRLYALLIFIPIDIREILISYILKIDEWDIRNKGKYIKVSGKYNQIVECTNPQSGYQTILGCLPINSGKHNWKFKVIQLDFGQEFAYRITVGVVKIDGLDQNNEEWKNKLFEGCIAEFNGAYGVAVYIENNVYDSCVLHPYNEMALKPMMGRCCDSVGDVFDIYVDLDNGQFAWSINGIYYGDVYGDYVKRGFWNGKEWTNVMEKGVYKMAMSLSCRGTAIQLMSYQELDTMPYV